MSITPEQLKVNERYKAFSEYVTVLEVSYGVELVAYRCNASLNINIINLRAFCLAASLTTKAIKYNKNKLK